MEGFYPDKVIPGVHAFVLVPVAMYAQNNCGRNLRIGDSYGGGPGKNSRQWRGGQAPRTRRSNSKHTEAGEKVKCAGFDAPRAR